MKSISRRHKGQSRQATTNSTRARWCGGCRLGRSLIRIGSPTRRPPPRSPSPSGNPPLAITIALLMKRLPHGSTLVLMGPGASRQPRTGCGRWWFDLDRRVFADTASCARETYDMAAALSEPNVREPFSETSFTLQPPSW